MKRARFQIGVIGITITSLLTLAPCASISAQNASVPELHVNRFKISADNQYIELYNRDNTPVDMTKVQLAYYNNYDVSKATTSKLISLTGELAPASYYLVNDSSLTLCYQTMVASASLGLSTTAGLVQVIYLNQTEPGGPFVSHVLDSIAWSKTAVAEPTDVQKLPSGNPGSFLQRASDYPAQEWAEQWPSAANPCEYESPNGMVEASDETFFFTTGELPPVHYVASVSEDTGMVNRNLGKAAPIINEMLPNPASPQTDADDEFVELYNPNDSVFDLSGFKLAFGSTTPKKYTFPEGTVLQAKEFKSFTSGDTSISLSNTNAQVWLLDPNDQVIGQSEPYNNAKDGQAWALDGGKWTWTLQPTKDAMNEIALSVTSTEKGKTAAATLGIGTTGSNSAATPGAGQSQPGELDDATPLHPGVLALVGLGTLAYTVYEYRQDMSNKLFQLRRYLRNRKALRRTA